MSDKAILQQPATLVVVLIDETAANEDDGKQFRWDRAATPAQTGTEVHMPLQRLVNKLHRDRKRPRAAPFNALAHQTGTKVRV